MEGRISRFTGLWGVGQIQGLTHGARAHAVDEVRSPQSHYCGPNFCVENKRERQEENTMKRARAGLDL
jgi:hypothetical protein